MTNTDLGRVLLHLLSWLTLNGLQPLTIAVGAQTAKVHLDNHDDTALADALGVISDSHVLTWRTETGAQFVELASHSVPGVPELAITLSVPAARFDQYLDVSGGPGTTAQPTVISPAEAELLGPEGEQ